MLNMVLTCLFISLLALPAFGQSVDWVRRYNGPTDSTDQALAIAVDGSGNSYVTGFSVDTETGYDYATIKYYPNGDTAWVRRYNGPGNKDDRSDAIAVDASGNVYVTGRSDGISGGDYATIKYYSNGDTAWVRRYDGPVNGYDEARAITIDDSGNVYVTGYSAGNFNRYDYATIKYHSNGDTAWVRRYNGLGNGGDIAQAIAVDNSGNVYVTGASESSQTDDDYATLKYYSNGDTAWVRRYHAPVDGYGWASAIAVDGSGSVYVTGLSADSGGHGDYATIKYYSNGDTAWVRGYNGPANLNDWAYAIAVDGSGSVYVTGYSAGSGTGNDYATIKYYSNGDTAWVRRYNGPGNGPDYANAIAVDGSGNAYVTGYCWNGTGNDYATIKYHSNGDTAWVRRYNGPGNGNDQANAIAVDGSGNAYVTGYCWNGTDYDYATIKYIPIQFLRGDANGDDKLTVADVVYLINYLFKGGSKPQPIQSADVNCDGRVTVSDAVYLVNYLFKGGPAPGC